MKKTNSGRTVNNCRHQCLPIVLMLVLMITLGGGCKSYQRVRATERIAKGDDKLKEHDLEAALAEFQAAARLAPTLATAHSKMGVVYRRMGDFHQAIDCYLESLRRNPFSFDDTISLAGLYQLTKQLKEAIQAYLHAVELKPDSYDAHMNLGSCYQESGDFAQAIDRFEQAIKIDPTRSHSYVNMGVALDAQGKYYQAIRAYREALERDSKQPLVLVNLAHTYMNQDRLKMARQALQGAIRIDESLAIGHEALGYCLFRMREFPDAKRSYERALTLDWRLPRAHAGLGSIKMLGYLDDRNRIDDRDDAIEHWHQSLELNPDQPKLHNLIAKYSQKRIAPDEKLFDTGH